MATNNWMARQLAKALDYTDFRNFTSVIDKAKEAFENSEQLVSDHLVEFNEVVAVGSGATHTYPSYKLSRYACYLIVQNADPSKEVVCIASNKNSIFVASNYDVMAFNEKGKDIWEFDKIGKPALRGVRYTGTVAYKTSNSNFMFADDNYVYITGSSKTEKKVFKENISVIDANTGVFVKKTDFEGING